ncbi:hypothetical protein AB840_03775 [Megasphaera cerevisiae DSM 20462]|uniref:Cyclic nucleotide-binding protein n=1 Tax=Megasphaera cerevisiae DSM 20462 TaxID=1122219 RepID=A0A0J6WY49_9FIRM|nr:DUF1003 domain-containing protein [Megasphaera cerevisiae]KMO87163.1 hypothetical protein AB840_03775 [Megasphaera cerevisiae DSM 20462]SJZ59373.1 Predicted membrane protein [Megasphaera cerevisiae DSM 20462]
MNLDQYKGPAAAYTHEHDAPVNVNREYKENLTFGQKTADIFVKSMGTWKFFIFQALFFTAWILVNTIQIMWNLFDPYPYQLMNLGMSVEAAFTAPIMLMSQNRQVAKDRMLAEETYNVNVKNEAELRIIMEQQAAHDDLMIHLLSQKGDTYDTNKHG